MPTAENVVLIDANETPVKNSAAGSLFSSESFDQIIPAVRTPITAASGGTQLQNIPCGKVWIRNGSGNQLMFIGGVNENAPYSGRGMSLYGGEIFIIPVKNTNVISLMANRSGEFIEYLGFLAGNATTINLSGIYVRPDLDPPTVVSVTPTSGASGSMTNSTISVIFSESMSSGTINSGSFVLRLSGTSTPLSGTAALVSGFSGTKAVFTPSSGIIQVAKVYNAYLGPAIQDLGLNALNSGVSGFWSWTTQDAPFLVSVQPVSGGSGIATNADITATFSQNMMSGTITTTAFTVRSGATSTVNLSGVAFLNTSNPTQAIFIPYSGIINTSGTYFARLATSITDVAGNPLNASGVWSWTTAAGAPPPDTTPPVVSGTTPISGESGVFATDDITVNFSEQVQSGTVTPTNLFLRISGNTWSGAVTLASDLKTATINPTTNLLNNSTYFINVLSGVKDLAGNFLSPYISGKQFTTLPLSYYTAPASGDTSVAANAHMHIFFSGYDIASGSVNTNTFQIQLSGTTWASSVVLNTDLREAELDPTADLYYSQTYYMYASGIQDINGNYMTPISGMPFTVIDATYNTIYNVAATAYDEHMDEDKFRIGMRVQGGSDLIGKNVQKVTVSLAKFGSPASGASGIAILLRPTGGGAVQNFGVKNPAELTTTYTNYSFTNTAITHNLEANDRIEVQWLSGSPANRVGVNRTNSNAFIGAVLVQYAEAGGNYSGGHYVDEDTSRDLVGVLYSTN